MRVIHWLLYMAGLFVAMARAFMIFRVADYLVYGVTADA
jgi:hypothetical protein